MKRVTLSLLMAGAVLSSAAVVHAQGKKKPRKMDPAPVVISEADSPASSEGRVGIVKAAEIYKTSLRQLLFEREAEAKRADEQMAKLKELYQDGLISRLQLENSQLLLTETHHKVEETRRQLAATDALVVESMADTDTTSVTEFDAMPTTRSGLKRVAYIRFKGSVEWSASEIEKVDEFFRSKFRRALPVAAQGQSDVHTRWGYDHRNAVDVGVHPDSAEGRALMSYLSSKGIPFMAFRRAVPGSSTGPHIHIGKSSQKIALGVR